MIKPLGWIGLSGLLLLGLAATPAAARQAAPQISAHESKDAQIVRDAVAAGLPARAKYAAKLEGVVGRAPAAYPMQEVRDGVLIVRVFPGSSPASAIAGATVASAVFKALPDGETTVRTTDNTYPVAAFLLGSYAIEAQDPQTAIHWLDKGLALQPTYLLLVTEKALALNLFRRYPESLALLDAGLADFAQQTDTQGRARALRARGWVLVELDRLPEAETAYLQSLELEPSHRTALEELAYIRKKRGDPNAVAQPMQVMTGAKAAAPK